MRSPPTGPPHPPELAPPRARAPPGRQSACASADLPVASAAPPELRRGPHRLGLRLAHAAAVPGCALPRSYGDPPVRSARGRARTAHYRAAHDHGTIQVRTENVTGSTQIRQAYGASESRRAWRRRGAGELCRPQIYRNACQSQKRRLPSGLRYRTCSRCRRSRAGSLLSMRQDQLTCRVTSVRDRRGDLLGVPPGVPPIASRYDLWITAQRFRGRWNATHRPL